MEQGIAGKWLIWKEIKTEPGAARDNRVSGKKITTFRLTDFPPFLQERVAFGLTPHIQSMLLARFVRGDLDGYPTFLWK